MGDLYIAKREARCGGIRSFATEQRNSDTTQFQARGTDVSNLHLFSQVIADPPCHDALWFVARDVFWSGDGMKHTARTSPGLSELYKSQTMSRNKTCIPSRVGSPYGVHSSEALRHGSNHDNMLTQCLGDWIVWSMVCHGAPIAQLKSRQFPTTGRRSFVSGWVHSLLD